MAKKTKKSTEKKVAQTAAPAVETTPAITPTAQQPRPKRANLIVAQRKFNRWYVYFKGVAPKENVGCGCCVEERHRIVITDAEVHAGAHFRARALLAEAQRRESMQSNALMSDG